MGEHGVTVNTGRNQMDQVQAHLQTVSHRYVVRYPNHDPRAQDPHKADFLEWKHRRKNNNTYTCDFATKHRSGNTAECDNTRPLEAHHNIVELAMMNELDFALLDADFPGISADTVGAWIDSDPNLTLLCVNHHRGPMGVHVTSFSDFNGEYYVRNLIAKAT